MNYPINEKDNKIKEIEITVTQKFQLNEISCFQRNKKFIIFLLSILGVITISGIIIIILILKSKSDDEKKGLSKNTNEQSNPITNKKCAEGYFIPDDDQISEDCQKCSLEGCITCVGTYENNICSDCGNLKNIYNNGLIVKCGSNLCETGEEEKCLSCEENKNECQTCNFGYILENGECLPDYFIKIIYYTRQKEDTIDIINDISDVKHIYI